MVHDVHKPGGAHDIAHAGRELRATLRRQGLRQVDYLKVRPLDYPNETV